MRDLFKSVANELIQQLTPEDLKEIMDSTIATVLSKMTPEQRLVFSKDVVNSAMGHLLRDLSPEQRVTLVQTLLPSILRELSSDLDGMSPEEIAALFRD